MNSTSYQFIQNNEVIKMPSTIKIIKPDITEEERQKRINEINEVLNEIAHKYCCNKGDKK